MHSDYDSAESTADSDLEDGELRKMLASPLQMQSREDCESFRIPIAPVKPAALLQERGASAPRKPAAMFYQEAKNCETNSRVLSSSTLTRQILGDPCLKGIKIIFALSGKI